MVSPITEFPNGLSSYGMPLFGGHEVFTTGKVYFVDSVTGSDNNDGSSPENALATIDAANNKCTASKGDFVIVMPNHAESLIADSAVDLDTIGVTVVGMGSGETRPTLTFTTAVTADFKLAANDVTVKNLLFKAGIDALTGPLEVGGDDCKIIDCEYRDDAGNNYETTDVLVTTSTPLRMLVDGFIYHSDGDLGGTAQQSIIQLNGADHAQIVNCWLVAFCATGVIEDSTTSDSLLINNCVIENQETGPTVGLKLTATTSGTVRNTSIRIASGTTHVTVVNDMQFVNSWGSSVDGETAILLGELSTSELIPGLGIKVSKSLNAFGTQDGFVVTGKVLVMLMIGEVTTVLNDTQVIGWRIKTDNTVLCADTTIGTDADGTSYMMSGDFGEVLNGTDAPVVRASGISGTGGPNPFILGDAGGSITLEMEDVSGSAASGVINWDIWYIPLESGAKIAAA